MYLKLEIDNKRESIKYNNYSENSAYMLSVVNW